MTTSVLLTGASGFVGQNVLESIVARGCDVRVVLRSGSPHPKGSAQVIYTPDLFAESPDWWRRTCSDTQTVVHAAWYAEPGKYLNSIRNMECLTGILHLAEGAMKAGVERFVGVGTCFE